MATNIFYKKELDKIAKKLKTLAVIGAPYKTGNLKSKLSSYNTLDRMVVDRGGGRASIEFETGPPGATYGQFWNPPATSKSKTKNRPEFGFADKALGGVDSDIDAYVREIEALIVLQIQAELNDI
jgi:hypothetical protein